MLSTEESCEKEGGSLKLTTELEEELEEEDEDDGSLSKMPVVHRGWFFIFFSLTSTSLCSVCVELCQLTRGLRIMEY